MLLVSACRTADAVAYKYGARDLSARLVDLMRWAVTQTGDPLLEAAVAYVRTETYFAARAHGPGLRALEQALDAAPAPESVQSAAARAHAYPKASTTARRSDPLPYASTR